MIRTTSPDADDSNTTAVPRELDSRISDGIGVQLLWYPDDGHVSVTVSDFETGEAFELEVLDRGRALDAFRHPYAYAAETRDWGRLGAHSAP
jgi:hypothetical protein